MEKAYGRLRNYKADQRPLKRQKGNERKRERKFVQTEDVSENATGIIEQGNTMAVVGSSLCIWRYLRIISNKKCTGKRQDQNNVVMGHLTC
jgi:hypothetical protein